MAMARNNKTMSQARNSITSVNDGLIFNEDSYLHRTGWMRSQDEGAPVDPDGQPLPWLNYPVIALLAERLSPDLRLFEYGSGYSTIYYAARVGHVTSIESDRGWCEYIRARAPHNVTLVYREVDTDGAYCRSVHDRGERYDMVVIDGRDRVDCLRQCLRALSDRGVVVLDDSHRQRYAPAFRAARQAGFRRLDIEGLQPLGYRINRTTIFYRDGNCLSL